MAPRAARFARGENIKLNRGVEVQFEFLRVLVRRHLRQARRTIGRANLLECFRLHCDSHNDGRRLQAGTCFVV